MRQIYVAGLTIYIHVVRLYYYTQAENDMWKSLFFFYLWADERIVFLNRGDTRRTDGDDLSNSLTLLPIATAIINRGIGCVQNHIPVHKSYKQVLVLKY